jgi:hypothetical protein
MTVNNSLAEATIVLTMVVELINEHLLSFVEIKKEL